VELPLEPAPRGAASGLSGREPWLVFAVLGAVLIVLFFAPTARATAWLVRRCVAPVQGAGPDREPAVRTQGARVHGGWGLLLRVLGGAMGLAGIALPPLLWRTAPGLVDVGSILLLLALVRLSVQALGPHRGGAAWGRELVRGAVRASPLAAAAVAALAWSGETRVAEIVAAQGAAPWQWMVFRNPVGFVLFPAYLAAAGSVAAGWERGSGSWTEWLVATLFGRLTAGVLGGLGAAIFAGGWQIGMQGLPALGWMAFGLKAVLVCIVAYQFAPLPSRHASWAVPLSLAAMGLSAAWLFVDLPPLVQPLSGRVLCAAAGCVLVYGVLAWRRARTGPMQPSLQMHPFL
jgi:hypothetical protein